MASVFISTLSLYLTVIIYALSNVSVAVGLQKYGKKDLGSALFFIGSVSFFVGSLAYVIVPFITPPSGA
ncbi:hypothetical protein BBBOND_0403960 [Babesia bigemina]|uniref:Uncharacterized protein n=1 Tax=Babesia bigemina TaxID=5866 RepID=A0A061DBI4_BABBI|nr:hypothetical protein BBBOND_0403960 [Babesia bigemina]CDR97908.1 hypothetical protein BBBOND_0403960 [Babesia bigemina]|eukprot:XP_012770094.1 hypothetical protein BBBOND_0403960 [Babesia bigemina]